MALKDLRILRLQAENVKRIRVVEITPAGDVVTITGKNGHGKTSVLDCILWALGGERPIQWKPIRTGEESAFIQLDLGNDEGLQLQVTRRFTAQDDGSFTTSLKLVTPDGMRPQGEQTLLNALIGALSFDPGEFIRAKPDQQVAILKGIIPDADFDSIAVARKKAFESRTDVSREEKRLRAAGNAITVEEGLPDEPIDTDALISALEELGSAARHFEEAKAVIRRAELDREAHVESKASWEAKAREHRRLAKEADDEAERQQSQIIEFDGRIAALPVPVAPADPADARRKVEEANLLNRKIARRTERAGYLEEADGKAAEAISLTAQLAKLDKDVVDLIAAADLPVSGLAIQDDMVFLRGVPFDQASDAEQLRAALALGIAANPKLRVIRIRDGGLFDDDAMQVIREVAAEENFQIWLEAVHGFGDPEEIVMENGEVKNG